MNRKRNKMIIIVLLLLSIALIFPIIILIIALRSPNKPPTEPPVEPPIEEPFYKNIEIYSSPRSSTIHINDTTYALGNLSFNFYNSGFENRFGYEHAPEYSPEGRVIHQNNDFNKDFLFAADEFTVGGGFATSKSPDSEYYDIKLNLGTYTDIIHSYYHSIYLKRNFAHGAQYIYIKPDTTLGGESNRDIENGADPDSPYFHFKDLKYEDGWTKIGGYPSRAAWILNENGTIAFVGANLDYIYPKQINTPSNIVYLDSSDFNGEKPVEVFSTNPVQQKTIRTPWVDEETPLDKMTAVLTDQGNLYTWGTNEKYQLGRTASINNSVKDGIGKVILPNNGKSKKIKQVNRLTNAFTVLTNDGTLYSWGSQENGQLGNSRITGEISGPTEVSVGNNEKVYKLSNFIYNNEAGYTNDAEENISNTYNYNILYTHSDISGPTEVSVGNNEKVYKLSNFIYNNEAGYTNDAEENISNTYNYNILYTHSDKFYVTGNGAEYKLGTGKLNSLSKYTEVDYPVYDVKNLSFYPEDEDTPSSNDNYSLIKDIKIYDAQHELLSSYDIDLQFTQFSDKEDYDNNELGSYTVSYAFSYGGTRHEFSRQIIIEHPIFAPNAIYLEGDVIDIEHRVSLADDTRFSEIEVISTGLPLDQNVPGDYTYDYITTSKSNARVYKITRIIRVLPLAKGRALVGIEKEDSIINTRFKIGDVEAKRGVWASDEYIIGPDYTYHEFIIKSFGDFDFNTPGEYEIVYEVEDFQTKDFFEVYRTMTVEDNYLVSGLETIHLNIGDNYNVLSDVVKIDLTLGDITIDNLNGFSQENAQAGTYKIRYQTTQEYQVHVRISGSGSITETKRGDIFFSKLIIVE